MPVIKSAEAPSSHRSFYWHLGGGRNPQWVVRRGDWKLLGNPQDRRNPQSITEADRLFLANLRQDKTESRNLASEHPEIVSELKTLQENYARSIANERSNK